MCVTYRPESFRITALISATMADRVLMIKCYLIFIRWVQETGAKLEGNSCVYLLNSLPKKKKTSKIFIEEAKIIV